MVLLRRSLKKKNDRHSILEFLKARVGNLRRKQKLYNDYYIKYIFNNNEKMIEYRILSLEFKIADGLSPVMESTRKHLLLLFYFVNKTQSWPSLQSRILYEQCHCLETRHRMKCIIVIQIVNLVSSVSHV